MAVPQPRYSKEEFARRGDEIYERDLRSHVEAGNEGKFIVIDIETGAYEIDADELVASDRLLARHPDAQVWLRQVGSRYARRFGTGSRRKCGMITGAVTSFYQTTIRLIVRGPTGQAQEIEAVIDTVFDSALSLPLTDIAALGFVVASPWTRAAGPMAPQGCFDIYEATVLRDPTFKGAD